MTARKLKDVCSVLRRGPKRPEISASGYQATPAELNGIDRGLKATREGRFATSEKVEEFFRKHRPA